MAFKLLALTILFVALGAQSSPTPDASCTINSVNDVNTVVSSCTTITVGSFTVPAGTTMIMNLKQGSKVSFTGTIDWAHKEWNGYLLEIIGNSVTVEGTGNHLFHGHGEQYWDGLGGAGTKKPTFMYLKGTDSTFKNFKIKNCPMRCVAIDGSNNLVASGFTIDNAEGAPGTAKSGKEGHNTDGFDIDKSTYVTVKDATVTNQDDCVAINGAQHITIDNFHCIGSHGFDIATGMSSDYDQNVVQNVTFSNSVLDGGMYGIHILTCNDGGQGKVDTVYYKNIKINGPSDYGVMFQQDFSNAKQGSTGNPTGNVPISNVYVNGVSGTMNGQYSSAVTIRCAACSNISFDSSFSITGAKAKDECKNFQPTGYTCKT
ncbi:polygalacturonase-like [Cylas formicarius]|uniref:polygalacturonase-like n=1 Tax=Cylas formicarius TaxID=197179 RepID=UPI0029584E13|nr:polygalacturonase-like [Cylas formicarius]